MTSHGGRANKTGKTLESIVVPALTSQYGFTVMTYPEYTKLLNTKVDLLGERTVMPKRFLITGAPYTTLYGSSGKTEFMLIADDALNTSEFPLEEGSNRLVCRIECKWQQSAGSVDEKFPYLYLSCVEAMPEKNILILYGGGAYRIGAINWLKNAVRSKKYFTEDTPPKCINVMSIDEFMRWISHAFDSYKSSQQK